MKTATIGKRRWISADELIVAGLGLGAISGFGLAPHFDATHERAAIATWLLTAPQLGWVRAVHFWSAAVLLVGVAWRVIQAVRVRRCIPIVLASAAVGILTYLVASGVLLRGDPLAERVRSGALAWFETRHLGVLGTLLWGHAGGANLMLFMHAVAAVPLVALLVLRRDSTGQRVRWTAVAASALTASGIAGLCTPGLYGNADTARSGFALLTTFRRGSGLQTRLGDGVRPATLTTALGQPEGCLGCHADVRGLGAGHDPKAIGCASCHLGDTLATDAARAHRGMVRIPGNLADAVQTCGQVGCHETMVPRVERSIMTTMAGVVSVDRQAFGEFGSGPADVRALRHSAADTHLRQLCASCHLGQTKDTYGANSESARGGGCNACHLIYSPEATRALAAYRAASHPPRPPDLHPRLSVNPEPTACFGCHSRSGRISTNYEGWIETETSPPASAGSVASQRQLADGRTLVRADADVHHERGLECIDCHPSNEVMGRGVPVRNKHEQSYVRCEDCHATRLPTLDPSHQDAETETLLRLRGISLSSGERLAVTRTGDPLVNVIVGANGHAELIAKRSGQAHPLQPPAAVCRGGRGHARLSCESCHTAWAPRCVSCHTTYDPKAEAFDYLARSWVKGSWQENGALGTATPPTLGIRIDPNTSDTAGTVDVFSPGMILELDRQRIATQSPDPVFARLYARVAPHTTRREARSCTSCHNDPVALGFGEGTLRFESSGAVGRWRFTPKHAPSPQDGLPTDAWTGFLATRHGRVSTRDDVRPFTVDEQKRVLAVGACLTCHDGASAVMRRAIDDFPSTVRQRLPSCVVATWPADTPPAARAP